MIMFKTKIGLHLLFVVIICMSCAHAPYSKIVSVKVSYIKGYIETPSTLSCGKMAFMKGDLIKDTILDGVRTLSEIELQLANLKEEVVDSIAYDCDIRMHCLITYKDNKTIKLCIGQLCCIIEDNKRMKNNDTLVYLIRKISGYYNYFSKDWLDNFDEVTKFGIPDNYKDLSIK
jgi:hypothetical protein